MVVIDPDQGPACERPVYRSLPIDSPTKCSHFVLSMSRALAGLEARSFASVLPARGSRQWVDQIVFVTGAAAGAAMRARSKIQLLNGYCDVRETVDEVMQLLGSGTMFAG